MNQETPLSHPSSDDDDEINLGELLATLLEYKWIIIITTLFALALGGGISFVLTPIYRADALLQIEDKSNAGGIAALADVQGLMKEGNSINAEKEIILSRMVLGRVIERLNLTINAKAIYLPKIGAAIVRSHLGSELAPPLYGLSQYAWGGERISIERLDVDHLLLEETLTLLAEKNGHYQVLLEDKELLKGKAGVVAQGNGLTLFVSELHARPGTSFHISRLSKESAIDSLRGQLEVKERSRNTSMLEVALLGPDPVQAEKILNEVLNAYLRQNIEFRSAEAQKTLTFLEEQLPQLQSKLESAESAFTNYRKSQGSVDLTLETKGVLEATIDVDNTIFTLLQKRDELRRRYTAEHPQVQGVDAQIERLQERQNVIEKQVLRLPNTQQTALRLMRDVEVSTALYTGLLNSAQQLKVARAGTVGNVRIIDTAVAGSKTVKPRKDLIVILSGVAGLFIGILIVFIRRSLRLEVDDPSSIESKLGLPVYATVPQSKVEAGYFRRSNNKTGQVLAILAPDDDALESLRSLRTTLHFALIDSPHKSILITGPAPGVGKSFISRNLAVILAQSGKRVVVIDADMRKGHIHTEFNLLRDIGLSEYISGTHDENGVLKCSTEENLTVITTGQIPPNPSELLMHPRFVDLLHSLEQNFDIIIVDAPPILAVSDAAIIGRHVGATLMVVRAGRHPMAELEQSVSRLSVAGVKVKGFVLNGFDTERARHRYGNKGYVYRYKYD